MTKFGFLHSRQSEVKRRVQIQQCTPRVQEQIQRTIGGHQVAAGEWKRNRASTDYTPEREFREYFGIWHDPCIRLWVVVETGTGTSA